MEHVKSDVSDTLAKSSRQDRGIELMKPKIVAVDGPAGSGKSSICGRVCHELGWTYVNTGAIYRAVGVVARIEEVQLNDEEAMAALSERLDKNLIWQPLTQTLFYRNLDLTDKLHTIQAGNDASNVARQLALRQKLLPLQRRLALEAPKGAIVDGRDIGTVVFPDADLKIFMTASLEERARRRLKQLELSGKSSSSTQQTAEEATRLFEGIKADISTRDNQDRQREASPMVAASDAIVFDTSHDSAEQAVARLIAIIRSQIKM